MRVFFRSCLFCAILGWVAATPARCNIIVDATFDSSITSDSAAAGIEAAINSAIAVYEGIVQNDVTVRIYFEEATSGLGFSDLYLYSTSYTDFYDSLLANDANPDAIAALNANGGNANTNGGINPVTFDTTIDARSANLRALGYSILPGCSPTGPAASGLPHTCSYSPSAGSYDGIIGFNRALTYPPQVQSGTKYGLESVIEHEIDEVLGVGSALVNCNPNLSTSSTACKAKGTLDASNDTVGGDPMPLDLFRWSKSAGGSRTLSTNCTTPTSAYFSYGASTGAIAQFNNSCNGNDFGDWSGNSPVRVQDAVGTPGTNPRLGLPEISALTAIGYVVPEPGTWILLLSGLAGIGVFAGRRGR